MTVTTGTGRTTPDPHAVDDDGTLAAMTDLKGTDCFTQTGELIFTGSPEDPNKVHGVPLPQPPEAIESASAANMLAALSFTSVLGFIIQLMSAATLASMASSSTHGASLPPVVVILDLTTDQASANLKLVRYLVWSYKSFRQLGNRPFLLMFRHGLCQTHQLSLTTRSIFSRIAGLVVQRYVCATCMLLGQTDTELKA